MKLALALAVMVTAGYAQTMLFVSGDTRLYEEKQAVVVVDGIMAMPRPEAAEAKYKECREANNNSIACDAQRAALIREDIETRMHALMLRFATDGEAMSRGAPRVAVARTVRGWGYPEPGCDYEAHGAGD